MKKLSGNSIHTIVPYAFASTWVFDDEATNLIREPFVGGMSEIITEIVNSVGIKDADTGFRLTFSANPFPNYTHSFEWLRFDFGGNLYYCPENKMTGWLCPALLKYFNKAPKKIYAKADSINKNYE
jgi:hypothetical protein